MDHRLTSSNLSAASLGLHLSTASPAPSHSSASTPVSACSPAATSPGASSSSNVPQIAIRPNAPAGKQPAIRMSAASPASMASIDSPSAAGPLTMTSKEWVIPPRPKPGRKPATDTPPTKRKAQNRAAQRAFRERRAARVGELEEQLDEQKEEHDKVVQEFQERISHLEIEAQTLMSRCQWLEAMLEKERLERNEAPKNDGMSTNPQLHPRPLSAHNTPRTIAPAPPAAMPEPQSMAQSFSISQIVSPPAEPSEMPQNFSCGACPSTGPCICAEQALQETEMPFGCGGCTTTSRCACLEESIQASINADLKRPRAASPGAGSNDKRHRTDSGLAMEMDYTHMFAQSPENNRQPAPSAVLPQPSIEIRESCGFCKDGSYCVCADTMMATVNMPSLQQHAAQQTQTPPPCEDDVVPIPMEVTATGAIKLPFPRPNRSSQCAAPPTAKPAESGGCGPNGPGTCAQCLSDPISGLFCRSLAANLERTSRQQPNGQPPAGCCGNGGPGGCCKTGGGGAEVAKAPVPSATLPAPSTSAGFGLSLSCVDAYKTLASHRHFEKATDDIGSWLPKLRAVPVPPSTLPAPGGGGGGGGVFQGRGHLTAGRAPIEVEAASIMSVLKGFDVRFGRGE